MSGAHEHRHAREREQAHASGATVRALSWTLALNAAFMLVEGGLAWWTGSLALLSDATHMLSDVAAISLALGATWLARRPARPERSYGFLRAEALGAFVNGLALLVIAGFIVAEAIERATVSAPAVAAMPVLIAGLLGLAINLGSAWFLTRGGAHHRNLNLRGVLLHMLADALGSAAAVLAAIGLWLGHASADAIASMVVAAIIAWSSVKLVRDTARVLLEFAPPGARVAEVQSALSALDGVAEVHDLHLWSLDGVHPLLSAHLVTTRDDVLPAAVELLAARFHINHATLQLERQAGDCAGCRLAPHAH